jgi:hypothetical protein
MKRMKLISCILFQIFFSFLSINLVKSLELKKAFVMRKELKFKLRSLDEGSTEDDDGSQEEMSDDQSSEESVDESVERSSEDYNTTQEASSDDQKSSEESVDKSSEDDNLSKEETSDDQESLDESVDESLSESTIPESYNGTVPSSTTPSHNTSGNTSNIIPVIKKSSSGLSTGAICAIVIPCIAALLAVAIAAALLKGAPAVGHIASSSLTPIIEESVAKFNAAVDSIPMQRIPQPIKVQPVQEVVRPNYPVNRVIEPPRVTQQIQRPIVQQPQQVELVPVQQVEMVPVQQVEMVPVQQVDMVPVQQVDMVPVQQVDMVPVEQVEMVPVQQTTQVTQIKTTSVVP